MSEVKMGIFDRIVKLCDEQEISVYALEQKSGVGNGTIGRWNVVKPSVEKMAAVAKVLHVTIDYLYGTSPYRNAYEEWDARFNSEKMSKVIKHIEAVDTIAAHLEDKELTKEKIEALTKYADLLFDKRD